ncbi:MAG: efflux RND transporter permease subunit [Acidobacteria bacterium]|nr:efflux RND transporter permease subunit [Acidobacteriota bacterium]
MFRRRKAFDPLGKADLQTGGYNSMAKYRPQAGDSDSDCFGRHFRRRSFPLGSEFIPRLDEGDLAVQVQQLPVFPRTINKGTTTEAEKVLMEFPEVKTVISKTGRAEVATDPMSGVDFSDLYIGLKPKSEWKTTKDKTVLIEKDVRGGIGTAAFGHYQLFSQTELRVLRNRSQESEAMLPSKFSGDDLDVLKR